MWRSASPIFLMNLASSRSLNSLGEVRPSRYSRQQCRQPGSAEDREVTSMPVELWDHIMAVNARGTMLACKHALPLMIAGGGGSIINISSGTSTAGDFFATAYAASKGAINTFTRYVATQYGSAGIRCNALVLGLIATPVLRAMMPEPLREIFREKKSDRAGSANHATWPRWSCSWHPTGHASSPVNSCRSMEVSTPTPRPPCRSKRCLPRCSRSTMSIHVTVHRRRATTMSGVTMKALVLEAAEGPDRAVVKDIETASPKAGEVLVAIKQPPHSITANYGSRVGSIRGCFRLHSR